MHVRVRAFAKINLCLEVLNRRLDGFHNLRTIFQTISLHDTLDIELRGTRRTRITLESDIEIPGENLILRAARAVLEATGRQADVAFTLRKRIPMGGGLGGGSTDAAAVLITLPRMLRRHVPHDRLVAVASELGSDIPFFLLGGTAVGAGKGTELYPMPDARGRYGLIVAPPVHVSTADAYRALERTEAFDTTVHASATEETARSIALGENWSQHSVNDFELPVFRAHPTLAAFRRHLEKAGASPARMTGSGAALFGLFQSREQRNSAESEIRGARFHRFSFVSRRRYRASYGIL